MRDKLRWLAVPPALALLLMFGPWRNPAPRQSDPAPTPTSSTPDRADKTDKPRTAPAPLPDMTQVVCTVVGVCLLGGAIVIALSRLRHRQNTGTGSVIQLRQSVRLSNRHAVHAVQFDDKILLLGECEGSLRVLHSGDDRELVPATHAAVPPEEEGAVLKDMVLPRPTRPSTSPARTNPPTLKRGLGDFRTLLSKTHAEA